MNIRQTSLAIAMVLALSFISVLSFTLINLYRTKIDSIDTQASIEAASILNKAIIELSLERSVMQVTLNLDDPIQPQFRDLLDGQRIKSDEGFQSVRKMVSDNEDFKRKTEFLQNLQNLQKDISLIRTQADKNLKLPLSQRDPLQVENLPPEMKDTILAFSKLPLLLKPQNAPVPSVISKLEKIQHSAWAIREYGGRERTYMAIATATGRPFTEATLDEMKSYHAKAVEAMAELNALSGYAGLPQSIIDKIDTVREVYFGSYEKTRESLISASSQNLDYPISFTDFFTESSEALGKAVTLSYMAGDDMVAYMEEERQTSIIMFWVFSGVLAFSILLCGFQIYYTQYKVSGRTLMLADLMERLTKGDTDIDLSALQTSDEIGAMAKHVEVFKTNAIEVKRMQQEQITQQEQAEEAKRQAALTMANKFQERIGIIVENVEIASSEVNRMSTALAESMSKASSQSTSVASASHEATTNVQTVAAAAEEMSATIKSIADNVSDTARTAQQSAATAEASQDYLVQLQNAVEDIGSVIEAINDVAEQTNLLALNATIEAARAGEAGKGFAVVASEVKSLANETHKMTDEISSKVQEIKDSAQKTIDSVKEIITQIGAVDEKTSGVAAAIEQQSNTTMEISQSVMQAAEGTSEVSKNIELVQAVTNEGADSTEKMNKASQDLLKQSQTLKEAIDGFLSEVRAG